MSSFTELDLGGDTFALKDHLEPESYVKDTFTDWRVIVREIETVLDAQSPENTREGEMASFTELDLAGDSFVFATHDTDGDGQTDAYGIKKYSDSSTVGFVKDDPNAWAVTQAGLLEHEGTWYLALALDGDGDGTTDSLTITKKMDTSSCEMVVDRELWTFLADGTTDGDAVTKKMDSASDELFLIGEGGPVFDAALMSDWMLGL